MSESLCRMLIIRALSHGKDSDTHMKAKQVFTTNRRPEILRLLKIRTRTRDENRKIYSSGADFVPLEYETT